MRICLMVLWRNSRQPFLPRLFQPVVHVLPREEQRSGLLALTGMNGDNPSMDYLVLLTVGVESS